ncbi:MAG: magnesium/cobalt transporter CorA [Candidatus Competibacter sp.]|nr:magnesium/cobalt transporter CorA [Candidatus Competibacter sp.]MDG4606161.1 magnesium/cobalt transporter CorA [Candidatus Contendobacter sp.]HUN10603.1 magnesium/cobalt transporter CorA [Aggregatilineales bacterium]
MIRILHKVHAHPACADRTVSELPALLAADPDHHTMLWVDLFDDAPALNGYGEPGADPEINRLLREVFAFDPLAVDDALSETHVPKVDDWARYLYIVLHAVVFKSDIAQIDTRELDVFLGHNLLVTYHFEPIPALEQVWKQAQRDDRYWVHGADYLLYELYDRIATDYMPCLDEIEEVTDQIQDAVFNAPAPEQVTRILHVKRAVLRLRRILSPQREVINRLARDLYNVVDPKNRVYFRDVYDHFVRLADLNESVRDLVTGALDSYLSVMANRTNEVMKVLTVVTTLFMPLTFLTGFFGMNFFGAVLEVPQAALGWPLLGLALLGMVATPLAMFGYMRRRRWL